MMTLASCCLSAAGIGFLGILSRPGIPPLLRSAYRAASGADPSGVSMFRTRETRPGPGALCTPGTAVPARPRVNPAAAAGTGSYTLGIGTYVIHVLGQPGPIPGSGPVGVQVSDSHGHTILTSSDTLALPSIVHRFCQ